MEDKEDNAVVTALHDPDRFDLIELKKIFESFSPCRKIQSQSIL